MTFREQSFAPTILLYTQEQRGNQLVESPIVGMIADSGGMEKLIVVKDRFNDINFVYKIQHDSSNLDAVSIVQFDTEDFDGRKRILINGTAYKLGTPDDAKKLLRGKVRWIQDKGSVLSVLLEGAATKTGGFSSRRIQRARLEQIPADAHIERICAEADVISSSPQK